MSNFPYIGTWSADDAIKSLQSRFPMHTYKIHEDGYVAKKRKTGEKFERVCLHNKKPHVCQFCKDHYKKDENIIRKGCVKPAFIGPLTQAEADPFYGRNHPEAPVIQCNFTDDDIIIFNDILKARGVSVGVDCFIFDESQSNSWNIRINYQDKSYTLQHFSWMLATKRYIPDGFIIRHTCLTKGCYNSKHLIVGTQRENMLEDKIRDGTLIAGEKHHAATITDEVALAIYRSKGQGTKQQRADRFGTTFKVVKNIDSGKSWGWVTGNHKGRNKERESQQIRRDTVPRSAATPMQYQKLVETIMRDAVTKADTGCIEPVQAKNEAGYTVVGLNGHQTRAHIVMWEYYHNNCVAKDDNLVIRHIVCNNPACCNPKHLTIGTRADNFQDQYDQDRRKKRSKRPDEADASTSTKKKRQNEPAAANTEHESTSAIPTTEKDDNAMIYDAKCFDGIIDAELRNDFNRIETFKFDEND